MKRVSLMSAALGALGTLLVAGCPGPTTGNPPRLWLAPNGDELHVQLSPIDPNPY